MKITIIILSIFYTITLPINPLARIFQAAARLRGYVNVTVCLRINSPQWRGKLIVVGQLEAGCLNHTAWYYAYLSSPHLGIQGLNPRLTTLVCCKYVKADDRKSNGLLCVCLDYY